MKAAHIAELRTAVNAVRSLAGQSAATWTHASISTGDTIYKDDVQDLRDRLNDALVALSIQTSDYEDQTLAGAPNGRLIKAVHIRQLRTRSTQGTGGSGSGGTTLGVHWMVTDQLGTPRMVFDQSGSLANVSRHDYLPFGEELGANIGNRTMGQGYNVNDNERKKFTGYERDTETGLDFAQARYYGNTQGRFTSPDPFSGSAILADPQTFNRYAYCRNNPVNSTDPTGMAPGAMAMPSGERVNAAQGMMDQVRGIIAEDEARFEKYMNDASSGLSDNTSVTVAITEDSSKDDSSGSDEGKDGDPQNHRDAEYPSVSDSNSDCSISITIKGDTTDSHRISRKVYTGYGFAFDVSGHVNSDRIGHVGDPATVRPDKEGDQRNGGNWVVGQWLYPFDRSSTYADGSSGKGNPDHPVGQLSDDSPNKIDRKIRDKTFSWKDAPGFGSDRDNPLISGHFSANFLVYAQNGPMRCAVRFSIEGTFANGRFSGRIGPPR